MTAFAVDTVRLGNLKFAHYGAVSYMKEIAPQFGLKIEERIFSKGLDIVPAVMAGEIDVTASGMEGAIAGRAAGAPVFLVAGFADGGVRIIARSDLAIRSIPDLKGKKVGVTRGGTQEIMLLAELAKHNLTWSDKPGKDVELVYLAYPDLNQALQAKEIDVISQSEPYASQAIRKKFAVEIIKPYDTPLGNPVRGMVMTEKMYKEHPDVAKRFLECLVFATNRFNADPKLAEKYVRESMFKNQVSSEDYHDAMDNASFTVEMSAAQVQRVTDAMYKYGMGKMKSPPVATDWVRLDLLEAAKKSVGKTK